MLLNQIEQAQDWECKKVGIRLNAKKTKSRTYNINNTTPLHTTDGTELEWTQDFKYLGSWVDNSEKDISVRKAQAWRALNGMAKIWKSSMSRDLKMRFFIATIESILLYGCESWTLSEAQEKVLSGLDHH